MQRFAPFALAALLAVPAVYAQEPDRATAAKDVAERWLALTDAGKGGESWDAAASTFRGAVSREQWAGMLSSVRGPMGTLKSRKFVRSQETRQLPGMPEGDYVVLQYGADFASRAGATETLVVMRDGQDWKVTTYMVQ